MPVPSPRTRPYVSALTRGTLLSLLSNLRPTGQTDVAHSLTQIAAMLRHRSVVMIFASPVEGGMRTQVRGLSRRRGSDGDRASERWATEHNIIPAIRPTTRETVQITRVPLASPALSAHIGPRNSEGRRSTG